MSPLGSSKGFGTNDCRNGQNLWFHEKDRALERYTSVIQKDQSDRLSLPRRIAQKWDDNIKFFEDIRASSNLSSTNNRRSKIINDPDVPKTYEDSLRKSI